MSKNWVVIKDYKHGIMGYLKRVDNWNNEAVKVMCEKESLAHRFTEEDARTVAKQLNLIPLRLRKRVTVYE